MIQFLNTDILIIKNTKALTASSINEAIKTTTNNYIQQTKELQKKTPKATLEQLQRLNNQDLKITQDSKGNNQYLEFKLNQTQVEELFNIMAINYEAITLKHLKDKNIHYFDKIKEKEEDKKEYYREFIPFFSATYLK